MARRNNRAKPRRKTCAGCREPFPEGMLNSFGQCIRCMFRRA